METNYAKKNARDIRREERKPYFDVQIELPRLPEGTRLVQPFSPSNPVAEDLRTGMHYKLLNGVWIEADK